MLPISLVRLQEVREVSFSVLHYLSLEPVLEMAQWCCNSVFYIHDLIEIAVEYVLCRTLGPFVVVGTEIP